MNTPIKTIDKIEIISRHTVQVREATTFNNDGILATNYSRRVIVAGSNYSNEPDFIKNLCDLIFSGIA
jgi:uncharacterized HAD superfamily protein